MMFILCMLLKVINKIKVTYQGQGCIKVKSQGSMIKNDNFTYFHTFNPLYFATNH